MNAWLAAQITNLDRHGVAKEVFSDEQIERAKQVAYGSRYRPPSTGKNEQPQAA